MFRRDSTLYRQVNRSFAPHFDSLMSSGLYGVLVQDGLLIPHTDVGRDEAATAEAYTVLRPEPVPFVSYPYEWCFGELKDAALATLRIQHRALDAGMSLRDASAYNIQFIRGRPVLVDTLSFETVREGEPWVAYRQFCQHFLAPLALMSYRDVRLGQLLRVHIDGVPLDLARSVLPRRARLRPAILLHLFAHGRARGRPGRGSRRSGFSLRAFRGLVDGLEAAVRGLTWTPESSPWSEYYGQSESYATEAMEHKEALVTRLLDEAVPRSVWDLGANTGRYSRIASDRGIRTVSFDADPAVVETSYRRVVSEGEPNLLPLVLDLANPSPPIGWANRERMTLGDRGPVDLVMALALLHHVAIGNNVPLGEAARFLHDLGETLIIEFVPKSDPMVQQMLELRDDVFAGYTVEQFERSFAERFRIEQREAIRDSERTLYLMRAHR